MFLCDIKYYSLEKKKYLNIQENFQFLHMLLKFEIIWTRIGQIIRVSNDI